MTMTTTNGIGRGGGVDAMELRAMNFIGRDKRRSGR